MEIAVLGLGKVAPELLRRPLEPLGYRIVALASAAELRAHARAAGPELRAALLPPRLAGTDLAGLIGELKAGPAGRGLSTVVVGGGERTARRIGELGADAHLDVPFSDADVLRVLGPAVRKKKLILLADDSPLIHKHTVPILKQAGYDVIQAYDGEEGLELARARSPELVITDVEMPRRDGYELCRALKSGTATAHIPVLMCSSLGQAADLQRGFDAGTDDYLVKPVSATEVTNAVAELLAGSMPASRELILVVDDSAMTRLLVSDCLARQGFRIEAAENGARGLEKARLLKPALIISDYEMPELNGFEMLLELRRGTDTRDIPVIMLSARDSTRDHKQLSAAGARACLVKPFTKDKCVVTVERVLAERRLQAFKRGAETYFGRGTFEAVERRAQDGGGDMSMTRAESRQVTVLFSDLAGFTPLAASMTPAEVIDLLNEYFDILCPLIRAEEGDIDKFVGDAIMAVFEEREGLEPSGLRATRAGLAMQAAMLDFQPWRNPRIRTRIGVNTGMAVRGDLGSRDRREFTVIGDAVNRANRYESACPAGHVMVSQSTYDTLPPESVAEPRHGIQLKGVKDPVTGWVVLSLPPKAAEDAA
ncbi:MAG: response regulator [Polyangiaceae bacterium]|nr:response regulator [Polyangiaceae bacterium]